MPGGSILESKVMPVIFQKKGNVKMVQKRANNWKFGQKSTKYENILKKGRWLRAIIAHNKLLQKTVACYLQLFSFLPLFLNRFQKWKNYSKMFEGSLFHTHFHPFSDSQSFLWWLKLINSFCASCYLKIILWEHPSISHTHQPAITCSKLTIETLDQGVKYVQS